jgi:integrase
MAAVSSSKFYRAASASGVFVTAFHDRQEKVTLGEYPAFSLSAARKWREECRQLAAHGESPMLAKRRTRQQAKGANTVELFAEQWLAEVVARDVKDAGTIRRVLKKDVTPAIGRKRLGEVTPLDVISITDRIKARGADQMALVTRNILKRLFAYAIAREQVTQNPAAAVMARYIAQPRSRERALTPGEIGALLRSIYSSSMRRANKLALHLLVICMVRKSELTNARWAEFDLAAGEWTIPQARMKQQRSHVVYLATQAVAMLEELRALSSGSDYVLPSRSTLSKPICRSTLNVAIRGVDLDIPDFVLHDFRRSASTSLHEAGFASDWIEKALAHEQQGVRGVYNRAEYAEQRRQMLQWWADFVDAQIDEGRRVVLGRFGRIGGAAPAQAAS